MNYLDELEVNITKNETVSIMYPLKLVIPFTIIYGIIFVSGVIGNISTCIVIAKNKSMHTATNYYLFSLALSDMLLLTSGLPPEMYKIWSPDNYIFGETFCFLQGFAAETSANATVLTITAFTIERYLAICHPFFSHTMSKLSRAIRYILIIWIIALGLAIPQAIQFGIQYEYLNGRRNSYCMIVSISFEHAFEISTFVFFVGPMTLITILYILIGVQLRKSKSIAGTYRGSLSTSDSRRGRLLRTTIAQNRVVNMLIAVVVAFFVCWAPFHAQRLLAVYLSDAPKETQSQEVAIKIYTTLMYLSGVLYYLSTTINPILYHILSKKFRKAFQATFSKLCSSGKKSRQNYSSIRLEPVGMNNKSDECAHNHDENICSTGSGISLKKHRVSNTIDNDTLQSLSISFSTSEFSDSPDLYHYKKTTENHSPNTNKKQSYLYMFSQNVMQMFHTSNKFDTVKVNNVKNMAAGSDVNPGDVEISDIQSNDLENYPFIDANCKL